MMEFALSPPQRRFAQAVGTVLMLVGAISFAASIIVLWAPGAVVSCDAGGCIGQTDAVLAAPDAAKAAFSNSPSALAHFKAYLASPFVHGSLPALAAIGALPFALLLWTAGCALRCLGTHHERALSRASPWLRRASFAALGMAVITPVTDSLRVMLLLPGTPVGAMWWIEADLLKTGLHLLVAFTAFVICWAIDVGSSAEREASDFV